MRPLGPCLNLMMRFALLGFTLVPRIVYAIIMMDVPGSADERQGMLKKLPDDVGVGKSTPTASRPEPPDGKA